MLGNGDAPLEDVAINLPTLRIDAGLGGGVVGTFTNDLRSGLTDAAGEFSGEVLDHGVAFIADKVAAYPDDDTFYAAAGVLPEVDGPTVVTLRLRRFGSLNLHARDADGQPTPGRRIEPDGHRLRHRRHRQMAGGPPQRDRAAEDARLPRPWITWRATRTCSRAPTRRR